MFHWDLQTTLITDHIGGTGLLGCKWCTANLILCFVPLARLLWHGAHSHPWMKYRGNKGICKPFAPQEQTVPVAAIWSPVLQHRGSDHHTRNSLITQGNDLFVSNDNSLHWFCCCLLHCISYLPCHSNCFILVGTLNLITLLPMMVDVIFVHIRKKMCNLTFCLFYTS